MAVGRSENITIMMVTHEFAPDALSPRTLPDEARSSIAMAVAQWLGSPRATSIARQRLRELGVGEAEIELRRRCKSDDRALAGILRLAVTFVIARGHIEDADLRSVKPAPEAAILREIAAAVAVGFYNVAIAESIDRTPYAAIDMQVGDY
jgi:hypothetical protein